MKTVAMYSPLKRIIYSILFLSVLNISCSLFEDIDCNQVIPLNKIDYNYGDYNSDDGFSQEDFDEEAIKYKDCKEIGGIDISETHVKNFDIFKEMPKVKTIGKLIKQLPESPEDYYTTDLESLSGLKYITRIKKGVRLIGNIFLKSLDGLQNVKEIGCCINDEDHLSIELLDNNLLSLKGFSSLETVEGGIDITNDTEDFYKDEEEYNCKDNYDYDIKCLFSSLKGLDNLKKVYGDLEICGPPLEDISSLKNIKYIKGCLIICSVSDEKMNNLKEEIGLENIGSCNY